MNCETYYTGHAHTQRLLSFITSTYLLSYYIYKSQMSVCLSVRLSVPHLLFAYFLRSKKLAEQREFLRAELLQAPSTIYRL